MPACTQMVKGLQEGSGRLLMIPTMVDLLPDGHETGEYWAVDFGGAVLHLLYTKLAADNKCVVCLYLPRGLTHGSCSMFGWLAALAKTGTPQGEISACCTDPSD